MLSYDEFLCESPDLKPVKTAAQIALKHKVPLEQIKDQLSRGIGVEREHTNKNSVARKIALAHLDEFPDYYDRLEKVEKK